ncbi:hypothetical protein ElyMa_005439600 [Elysia marginata]|uniref:Uncharacterized protein n=1 Tax=Elysia marginata TaxID=1093978 RepID=A0AAV4EMI6_9GAST|nr:hypothetical protein ElyMa_005439600 [Elysia marginata]
MSAGYVVRAVWLTLGVFVWLQPDSVTGFPSEDTALGEHHSSMYRLCGLAVKTLAQRSGGAGFDPWPSQTKDFKIGISS